ncbi:hypothetical protein GCG54_00006726 [Colletotrichum gloeosporioides]|uniref:Uncharacterized protein n=1 Tax=Colletotrichum gloeosporioides TaxID=474922 RepID=A0A8H4CCF5_COLGL|nr:uncharacterized protein GCG54_00006726 [Colletotrichum gloeosporioides]KAF3801218.1 hypothetical protein GCG54_00006726 [Colletotrichum gloeosporioides]
MYTTYEGSVFIDGGGKDGGYTYKECAPSFATLLVRKDEVVTVMLQGPKRPGGDDPASGHAVLSIAVRSAGKDEPSPQALPKQAVRRLLQSDVIPDDVSVAHYYATNMANITAGKRVGNVIDILRNLRTARTIQHYAQALAAFRRADQLVAWAYHLSLLHHMFEHRIYQHLHLLSRTYKLKSALCVELESPLYHEYYKKATVSDNADGRGKHRDIDLKARPGQEIVSEIVWKTKVRFFEGTIDDGDREMLPISELLGTLKTPEGRTRSTKMQQHIMSWINSQRTAVREGSEYDFDATHHDGAVHHEATMLGIQQLPQMKRPLKLVVTTERCCPTCAYLFEFCKNNADRGFLGAELEDTLWSGRKTSFSIDWRRWWQDTEKLKTQDLRA